MGKEPLKAGELLSQCREQAEALERERCYLRNVMETSPGAIIVFSRQGKITDVNGRAETLLGLTKEQLLGRSFNSPEWTVTDYEGNSIAYEDLAFVRVQEGLRSVYAVEQIIERQDGTKAFFVINAAPLVTREGAFNGAVMTCEEITARIRALQALARQKETAQTYFDVAGAIMVVLGTDGTVEKINKYGCELLGYSAAELVGKSWFDVCIPAAQREPVRVVFKKCLKGEIENVECWENLVYTREGKARCISWHNTVVNDESGSMVQVISSGIDVTQRRRMEAALRQGAEQLREMTANVPGMVYQAARYPDGTLDLLFVSEGVRELFGVEPAAAMEAPQRLIAMICPEDREKFWSSVQESAQQVAPWKVEGRVIVQGEERWVQGLSQPQAYPDGVIVWDGVITDITHTKTLQKNLQAKINKLERVNRIVVGREIKMRELKQQIKELKFRLRRYEGLPLEGEGARETSDGSA